jgi:hypothetical protein
MMYYKFDIVQSSFAKCSYIEGSLNQELFHINSCLWALF